MIDWNATIAFIALVISIICPIFTTVFNNIHQRKLKRMELISLAKENTFMHKQVIFENFLQSTGKVIAYAETDTLAEYGQHFYNAYLHSTDDVRMILNELNEAIHSHDFTSARKLLTTVTPHLNVILKEELQEQR